MVGPNHLLPHHTQPGLLLPSVHGFRLCRSVCAHRPQRPRLLHGRAQLRIHGMSATAETVPLEFLSFDGSDKGAQQLSLRVADDRVATGLVHRYVTLARQNARAGTASTLTRGEVRGGGRKPFAQKGTGNARQGSTRTPLKPGGGVIFGPKPRDWSIKMNKKERRLAYATAFQNAAESITVVDDLEGTFTKPRTKELTSALLRWGVGPEEHALIIVDTMFDHLRLASRNLARVATNTTANLSVYDLLRADRIIVETSALAYIQEFYGDKADGSESSAESAEQPAEAGAEPSAEPGAEESANPAAPPQPDADGEA